MPQSYYDTQRNGCNQLAQNALSNNIDFSGAISATPDENGGFKVRINVTTCTNDPGDCPGSKFGDKSLGTMTQIDGEKIRINDLVLERS